ncbi:VOC family protein [Catenulispora sp. NF23]|uniref:VOC family protein n=1 Tax=Catenulispora pinistramenti TaxID=2705254 RepID=UPI001BAB0FC3|nr:VOC family protein [Catenulispora pinistramenti]MBS2539129.1 VOC family protein [Catenulispora pinistramenti]
MTTETTPAPQVWPTLRATDAPTLIRFLTEAFGFRETVVYRDGDQVHHAELAWPEGGGIMLGSVKPSDGGDHWALPPGQFGAYVVTDHPDELFARAKAGGAEIVQEVYETEYGSRDFQVRDPEGNRWSFGTYRGHPLPGE